MIDDFKESTVFGPFLKLCDPAIVEIAGNAGFDFVIIDMEHGPISVENSQNLIRAAEIAGVVPIVRVSSNDEKQILRALDIGAYGVEVPEIDSKEQAEKLVESSYYDPKGERGVCRYVRASRYTTLPADQFIEMSNENIITIAHIEGKKGINNLDEILEVEELDIVFIGPYDLSQSMGIPGQVNNPKLIERMERVSEKCQKKDKIVGTFVESFESAQKWKEAGVQYIAYSVDVGIVYNKFQSIVNQCKRD